jgi:hypothetical protein
MLLSPGIALGSVGSGFSPASPPGLVLRLRPDLGMTLGGTLLAAGTSPPVVTITGTLAQLIGLRVEIQTTGARGVATFRWSADNGTTWSESSVTTAATYLMPGTGITLNFPTGTYTNNNVYEGTVTSFADTSGASNSLTQATATKQPTCSVSDSGHPGLKFDGSNDFLAGGTAYAQPMTIFVVAKKTATSGYHTLIDGATDNLRIIRVDDGTNETTLYALGAGGISDGTWANGARHIACGIFNGASSSIRLDGGTITSGNPGAGGSTAFTLGILGDGASNPWQGLIYEVLAYNRVLTAIEIDAVFGSLRGYYGI